MSRPGPFVHVLLIREDGGFTAQMLEMDFAARGETQDDALQCLARTVIGQARLDMKLGRAPLTNVKAAPQRFWDMWRTLELGAAAVPDVPPAFVINAALQASSFQLQWSAGADI